MSVDLDGLFEAMGRQADAVPLGGADRARERGRQRTRTRAVVSAAAAVLLLVVGGGLLLRQPAELALPADKRLVGTPMPEVGEPIDLGGQVARSVMAADSERAYVAWLNAEDNGLQVKAADLKAGMPAWESAQPIVDPLRGIEQVVVVPAAVLVVTKARDDTKPAIGLHAFNPRTGVALWSREVEAADSLVFTADTLVQLTARSGRVDGFDWVSGGSRWSRTQGEKVTRALGMAVSDDEKKYNMSGPSPTFIDGRIVLLTSGAAEVRDAATGDLRRSVPLPARGETVVAYDGWLFTRDATDIGSGVHRIRATTLDETSYTSTVLAELPGAFVTMNACGMDQVCVLTQTRPGSASDQQITKLTAIGVRERRVLWQRDSSYGASEISAAGGAALLTDENGSAPEIFGLGGGHRHEPPLGGRWLDWKSLLVTMPDGTGRLAKMSAQNADLKPYAKLAAEFGGSCASSSTRIACVDPAGTLKVWQLG
jgi:hypothetical protein